MNQNNNRVIPWDLVGYIAGVWFFAMLLLVLAQVLIETNGLTIYPSGEDFTWMRFIQPSKGYGLQQSWWALASRNPLAPWWYWYISPLILKFPETLYIARKVVELFLGIATLLVVYELMGRRRAWVAVWTALLVLTWNFSSYLEQVLFVMMISLVFTLLSIHAYLIYLHSNRVRYGYLIASLVMFFVALGTYTIQCGIPLVIMVIALLDVMQRPKGERGKALKNSIFDLLGYLCFFILFIQIWVTTSGPTSQYFKLDFTLFFKNIGLSIKYFIWHADVNVLLMSVLQHWSYWAIILVVSLSIVIYSTLTFFRQMRVEFVSHERGESLKLLLPLIVIVAISVPTLILESTSELWIPGTRSEMLQQIFNPVFYVFAIFLIIQLLRPYIKEKQATMLVSAFLVLFCTTLTIISLEYNRKLFEQSQFERRLVRGMKSVLPAITDPMTIIVNVKDYDWYDGHNPAITNLFIQYSYNTFLATMETIGVSSSVTSAEPIVFGAKEKGVYIPSKKSWVPYKNLLVFEINKNAVLPVRNFTPEQFQFDTVKFSKKL